LIILPTYACNFRCKYCYEKKNKVFLPEKYYSPIYRIIKEKLDKGAKTIRIFWFGGEPLICLNQIIIFLANLKKICKEYGAKIESLITTNFSLANAENFSNLVKAGCRIFQVTLDGDMNHHNFYRPFSNGKGSYDVILSNLLKAKQTKLRFKINIRLNFNDKSDYSSHFKEMKRLFQNDKRFVFSVSPICSWGGESSLYACDSKTSESRGIELNKMIVENGLTPDLKSDPFSFLSFCSLLMPNSLLIKPDGSVGKCSVHLNNPHNSFKTIFDKTKIDDSWWTKTNFDNCDKCALYPICLGKSCKFEGHQTQEECFEFKKRKLAKEHFDL